MTIEEAVAKSAEQQRWFAEPSRLKRQLLEFLATKQENISHLAANFRHLYMDSTK